MRIIETDVIVIGAGMAGASVAYFMAPHASVMLFEREAYAGNHLTGRSAALFSETYGSTQVRALTRAARTFLGKSTGRIRHPARRRHASASGSGAASLVRPDRLHEPGAADIDVNELHQGFLRGVRSCGEQLQLNVDIQAITHDAVGWYLSAGEQVFRAPLLP